MNSTRMRSHYRGKGEVLTLSRKEGGFDFIKEIESEVLTLSRKAKVKFRQQSHLDGSAV